MRLIDHLTPIAIPEPEWVNELTTLSCLCLGMTRLAEQVHGLERPMRTYEEEHSKRVLFFGFNSWLPPDEEQLLPCYFHWFGMSVSNYARLVGFINGVVSGKYPRTPDGPKWYQTVKSHCDLYVASVPELIEIIVWRNKVFAHFALTDPRAADSAALLDLSVTSPITYFNGRLRVGGVIHASSGAEAELPPWSLVESFENLLPRYWPELKKPEA